MSFREIRKRKKLTQSDLASRVGVTQAYISNLEKGKRLNPSVELLMKLATVLDEPVGALLEFCDQAAAESGSDSPDFDKSIIEPDERAFHFTGICENLSKGVSTRGGTD